MSLALKAFQPIQDKLKGTIHPEVLRKALSKFEHSYGEYTTVEVRQAIRDGFPVVLFSKANRPMYVIGEGPGFFVARIDKANKRIKEKDLLKAWDGDAIVITGETDLANMQAACVVKEDTRIIDAEFTESMPAKLDPILWAPEQDTWKPEYEGKKIETRQLMQRLMLLEENELPPHPMIVIFKEPSAKDKDGHNRGYIEGACAYIVDHDDPSTVILHELGHLFWKTRLTDDEKKRMKEIYKNLPKENLPAVFTGDWSHHDEEETFCTLYLWWIKGRVLSPGYMKIFNVQYPEGVEFMENIFARQGTDSADMKAWMISAPKIERGLKYYMGQTSVIPLRGRLAKAKLPPPQLDSYRLPRVLRKTKLAEAKGRTWFRIDEGSLLDQVVVVKAERLDWAYMNTHENFHKIPRKRRDAPQTTNKTSDSLAT